MYPFEKLGLYLLFIFFGLYYGLYPLLGGEVFIRNTGWVYLDMNKALINMSIGVLVFSFIKYRDK